MVKVYPNEVNLFQLAAIGRTPGIRTATTPFGMPPGAVVRYIGRSVPWKGVKGEAFWKLAEKHGRLAEGLRKAIDVSKACRDVTGVAIVALADGRQVVLPRKVVCQMVKQGKPVTVIAERDLGVKAKEVIKSYGIHGLYKGLVAGVAGGAAIAPAPG